jgi:hypothetical protein
MWRSEIDRVGRVNVNPPENSDLQLFTVGSSEGDQYASVGLALLLHFQQN